MFNYVLTCCSTADMPSDYFKKRDIPFIWNCGVFFSGDKRED
jgi:hypothetical protein